MNILVRASTYAAERQGELIGALGQHLVLVAIALVIGIVVCVPLGLATSRSRAAAVVVMNGASAVRAIPSLAILFLALPYFGPSAQSAAIALTILTLPPILVTTDAAFRTIDPAVREAAVGLGMPPREVLRRVEFPLALPIILAGIRTALVEVIASATLAAFIGGGGLGIYVTRGFALYDSAILLVGAIPVALLAVVAEVGMGALQRALQPPSA